ncbi:hypothetical protein IEQ34_003698 [Dendrobium chrysotoxum]|uniref:Uncharacterized protein n=1 Tax=Dendrobium chrysotoxum TaxID=161865 RepID=A0AAV7HGD2_DENCH|nr:hypothetical protein IEQ34_003698 [Dendrobium chrysotoxum]
MDSLSKLYIDHITKVAINSCNILLQPIIESSYWTHLIKSLYNDTKEFLITNYVDYGMFVCKYIKRISLEGSTTWTNNKSWQEEMPKHRAKFMHELFCKSLSIV